MYPINFTANFIKNTSIQQCKPNNTTENKQAALVELDINDDNDTECLFDTAREWETRGISYAFNIYSDAVKGCNYDIVDKEHYIALTTQKDDYEHLNPDKILGLVLFSELNQDTNEISWLQVDPDNNSKNHCDRHYKKVGSSMINYIKETYNDKPISVQAVQDAVPFYKKCGFIVTNEEKAPNNLILDCEV
ncbi:MAG: GNAT family N-acetyltransferase [Candidatus Gastranaerophilales bacterium]|nr:GNAT family N-acetyltransferase [Candidatus Gastranaerophilales bacterium]